MIVRVFRGIVHEGKQDEFETFFRETALPLLEKQDGLVSVSVGLPHESSPREFMMTTVWRDHDSMIGFTGPEWETAVVHPDEAHLLEKTIVHHYHALGE